MLGLRFEECADRGGRIVEAWQSATAKREAKKEAKKEAADQAKSEKRLADALAVARYVIANPGCTVTAARRDVVRDAAGRWTSALEVLGSALERPTSGKGKAAGLQLDLGQLAPELVERIGGAP